VALEDTADPIRRPWSKSGGTTLVCVLGKSARHLAAADTA